MRDPSGVAVRLVGTMQEIPASVVTERRMRRQQSALLTLVSSERNANLSLDDTLAQITALAGATLDVERTSVWLFTTDRSKLECRSLFRRSLGRQMAGAVIDVSAYPSYIHALEQNRALDAADAGRSTPAARRCPGAARRPSILEATVRMDTGTLAVRSARHVGPIRQWMLDQRSWPPRSPTVRGAYGRPRQHHRCARGRPVSHHVSISEAISTGIRACQTDLPLGSRRTRWRHARSSSGNPCLRGVGGHRRLALGRAVTTLLARRRAGGSRRMVRSGYHLSEPGI
jgi:hypothetical protein